MADFKMIMQSGSVYPISAAQRKHILQKSKLIGGNFPYIELDGGDTVVFYKHISEFIRDEYEEPEVENMTEEVSPEAVPTEDSDDKDIEARRKAALEEMMAKSSCKHDNTTMHYIEGKSSKGKVTRRYFPVCDFCGQRMRFVKADDVSDEEKESAVVWVDKD